MLFLVVGVGAFPAIAQDADAVEEAVDEAMPDPSEIDPAAVHAVASVDLDTVQAGRFDGGKMWTFEYPPLDYFAEAYGFHPDTSWFRDARLSALRIPGCSASFVSPNALVMTNHHCGRSAVTQVSKPGENLLDNGFYASSLAEERPVEGFHADQLIAIADVTDEVDTALEDAQTDAERAEARRAVFERIQQRETAVHGGEDAGVRTEVIALYDGGRYSAYTFQRYEDVRLVMTPELQLGYFGGDTDNFTYPRYALDMTFFRVYDENGEPLQTDHYFAWSDGGVEENDPIFVIGNPGSTYRGETVAQLTFRRDVREPRVLDLYTRRIAALQAYLAQHGDDPKADEIRNTVFGFRNGQKLYRGRVKALRDPGVMARREDAQEKLQEAIQNDPALRQQYGDVIEQMAAIQEEKRALAAEYEAFLALTTPAFSSAFTRRAFAAYPYVQRKQSGATDDALQSAREQLVSVEAQPPALQRQLLTTRLEDIQTYLGDSSQVVQQILQGRTPEATAAALIDNSVLSDSVRTAQAVEEGSLAMGDPGLLFVEAVMPRLQEYQSAWAGLTAQQQDFASQLGRARFEVYGTDVPPDATFSLRIADGVVKGYEYNGTIAPAYTTFYGLYDHYYAYGDDTEWDLPERWLRYPESFDLSTPLNFVSTADIIGGNSGSPVINPGQEIVGLIFDGNIESLSGDYIYLSEDERAVAVDARGILEALDEMYDADRIVLELTDGQLLPTEEEADAVMSSQP